MRRFSLLLFLALALAACRTGVATPGPAVVGDWAPTPAATHPPPPTDTPVPTATRTALQPVTPRPTPAPVVAPTVAPTAVPDGIYSRPSLGITLRYPTSWTVLEEGNGRLFLQDEALNLVISISTESRGGDVDADRALLETDIVDQLSAALELTDAHKVREEALPFAGDRPGWASSYDAVGPGGTPISIWIAVGDTGSDLLALVVTGGPERVAGRETSLRAIMAQTTLADARIFGLDRAETLVLLGGDPRPEALDPARTTGSAAGYVGLLYSGLVRLTPQQQVAPDLAETWSVSPDGAVYTFTLRDGLTFASGRPLTAADVHYSWERAADPATGSTTAATYLGDIVGVREKLAGEADAVAGLVVVDDRTLEVTLDAPKPYFLAKLTYPTAFVVDPHSVDEDDDAWVRTADVSGPYQWGPDDEDDALIFIRNDHYYAPPAIANVVYLLNLPGEALSRYQSGQIDITGLNSVDAQRVRAPSDPLHAEWQSATSLCTIFVQMNNTLPPMDDVNVRRALALAVDKEMLNALISNGRDVIAQSILPPAMPGHDAALVAGRPAAGDPDAARAALAASSYADGAPPLTLLAAGFGDGDRNDLNALIDQWRSVLGLEVSVEFVNPTNLTRNLRQRAGHLVSYGWCADYPDPENFLDVLYHGESDFNVANYDNPAVDALLEAARVEQNPAARLAQYQTIEQMLLDDGAAIPLRHGVSDVLVIPRVEGYVEAASGVKIIPYISLRSAGDANE